MNRRARPSSTATLRCVVFAIEPAAGSSVRRETAQRKAAVPQYEEENMLRLETDTGWWLVTHPDHARLAGAFAERWGNNYFLSPEPREHVLRGITRHDDGWAARDAVPQITRQGKPSAFSVELVGKYSAFEEIDLEDYLAVRDRSVRLIAAEDPYAAILISMHTYSLLHDHADRSTIAPAQLPLLDRFLDQQKALQ